MSKYLFLLTILSFFFAGAFAAPHVSNAQELAQPLSGKILLQVEQNGEAWYVNPEDNKRHFLGRPSDAFNLMRDLGTGISTEQLQNIPIGGIDNLSGEDSDEDGLPDMFEDAVGTDKNSSDTDNDGYSDKEELKNNFNPKGQGRLNLDNEFAQAQAGNILLQVEGNGEAWYIYPENNKRYFLGRPADALQIMRNLGLGISNNDFQLLNKPDSCAYVEKGDVYYEDEKGNKIKIAESLIDHKDPNNTVQYKKATLSPNKKFIAMFWTGFEETSIDIHNLNTGETKRADVSDSHFNWLEDGRLRVEGQCGMGIACGNYESVSADKPWKMEKVD